VPEETVVNPVAVFSAPVGGNSGLQNVPPDLLHPLAGFQAGLGGETSMAGISG